MYMVPAPLVPVPADCPEDPAPLLVRPVADVSPALLPAADDESRPAEPALLPPAADVVSRPDPELVLPAAPEPVVAELPLLFPPMADAPAPVDAEGAMRAFASTNDVLVVDDDVPDGD
jgi:hypothetical protein